MSRKVAIYGGSFNPIHIGHTSIAEAILRQGVVDEVWIMVSPLNPLKTNSGNEILPSDQRLEMARIATNGIKGLEVSDFESRLPVPSYTVKTLSALHQAYPDNSFMLIVGGDNWRRFSKWYKAEEIKSSHDIIVYDRSDVKPGVKSGSLAKVTLFRSDGVSVELSSGDAKFPLYDVSSSDIRNALKNKDMDFAGKWLHPDVFKYIRANHLYAC